MKCEDTQLRRAVIYLRVADRQQRGTGAAVATQRQACLQRAAELGMTWVHEYVDYDSGSLLERSGLQAMLGNLKARGDIEYVIAYDHARIARDAHIYIQIVWAIEEAGTRLEIAHTIQPQQEFMERIQQAIADIASRQHRRPHPRKHNDNSHK
jgi:DNA invertase Pin-like site-specific DNA recombinase